MLPILFFFATLVGVIVGIKKNKNINVKSNNAYLLFLGIFVGFLLYQFLKALLH